jgi:hypothetical protein
MLKEEARWFGQKMAEFESAQVFPMCDIGSSTGSHRTEDQPWIDELIFRPVQARGCVVHLDVKQAPGVDLVGDLSDPSFLEQLKSMQFRSVFCSNLLEHIEDPTELCRIIASILPEEGLLFASCPHRYPYHPDPIDTLFRPGATELAEMFPGTMIVESQLIDGGRYLGYRAELVRVALLTARGLAPFYRPKNWLLNQAYVPWLFRRVSAACVILKKTSRATA